MSALCPFQPRWLGLGDSEKAPPPEGGPELLQAGSQVPELRSGGPRLAGEPAPSPMFLLFPFDLSSVPVNALLHKFCPHPPLLSLRT